MKSMDYEVVIVGGGPAGSSAALVLGRCRRRVLLFDNAQYRNASARRMHGFLSRDGIAPSELRRISREEIACYPSVTIREASVVSARRLENGFELRDHTEQIVRCRRLLLATGLRDELPRVAGSAELLGQCLFHCPYCDGWELRDQPLAVYGTADDGGARFALELTLWSRDLVLCTDGPCELSEKYGARLASLDIPVRTERIARFEGDSTRVRVVFEHGEVFERRALFFNVGCRQGSDLPEQLGCRMTKRGGVEVGRLETTNVPGLYIAGDASRDALQAIVGAGEGSAAAIAINNSLIAEDFW